MEVFKTKLNGVLLIKPDIQEDFRGTYVETFNKEEYAKKGIVVDFVCDDFSTSSHGVFRGIHADTTNYKLISCGLGRLYFVVVDCDELSEQFGQWESFILTDTNHYQILVPPKFGNGHLVLSEKGMFRYKQSEYYDPKRQSSFRFDDPRFNIWWPIKNPMLSRRDEEGKYV